MELVNRESEIFVPDNVPVDEALGRTTHMAVSAHQDDIEIMAYDGILKCFGKEDRWFFGVVSTNGSGSPRDGLYADYTDEQMCRVRREEQKKAAVVGEYGALALLDYPSSKVKDPANRDVGDDIKKILQAASPDVVYVHNPADKHDTHIGVVLKTLQAIRELPPERRPRSLYGCEVWRALDWVNDDEKVIFDVAPHPNLAASLLGIYDSQICGGARYDLAAMGRRTANATFAESHDTDATTAAIYAMDLSPLLVDDSLDVGEYVKGYIERFGQDVVSKINKLR